VVGWPGPKGGGGLGERIGVGVGLGERVGVGNGGFRRLHLGVRRAVQAVYGCSQVGPGPMLGVTKWLLVSLSVPQKSYISKKNSLRNGVINSEIATPA
jgi:hypothetical protein